MRLLTAGVTARELLVNQTASLAKGPGECVTFNISRSRAGSDGARNHFENQESNLEKVKCTKQSVTHLTGSRNVTSFKECQIIQGMSHHSRNTMSPALATQKKSTNSKTTNKRLHSQKFVFLFISPTKKAHKDSLFKLSNFNFLFLLELVLQFVPTTKKTKMRSHSFSHTQIKYLSNKKKEERIKKTKPSIE